MSDDRDDRARRILAALQPTNSTDTTHPAADRSCPTFRWDCHDDPYNTPTAPRPPCQCGRCPDTSPNRHLRTGETAS